MTGARPEASRQEKTVRNQIANQFATGLLPIVATVLPLRISRWCNSSTPRATGAAECGLIGDTSYVVEVSDRSTTPTARSNRRLLSAESSQT
jgi:hypothetical protein